MKPILVRVACDCKNLGPEAFKLIKYAIRSEDSKVSVNELIQIAGWPLPDNDLK